MIDPMEVAAMSVAETIGRQVWRDGKRAHIKSVSLRGAQLITADGPVFEQWSQLEWVDRFSDSEFMCRQR